MLRPLCGAARGLHGRARAGQSADAPELAELRRALAPNPLEGFRAFGQSVFADGALPRKTKELIAVAAAHVTQCPWCIRSHTKAALQHGASAEEIMEAIWVASEMRAGAAYAHSALAYGDHPGRAEGRAAPGVKRMIRIKRVYDEPSPKDGLRVLVDRLWPRGLTKEKAAVGCG